MDIESALAELGLTPSEAKIYVSLLKTGNAKAGEIIRDSGLYSSVVYNGIKRLLELGLIGHSTNGKHRVFYALDPHNLLEIVHEKEKTVTNLLPQLIELGSSEKQKGDIFVMDGVNGVKSIFYDMLRKLKKGDEQAVMGTSETESELGSFIANWDERRIRKGIKKRVLLPAAEKKWSNFYSNRKLTEAKISDSLANVSLTINMYGNSTAILMWGKLPVSILIERKGITSNFRNYFEALWKSNR